MNIQQLKQAFENPEEHSRAIYHEAALLNEHMDVSLTKMITQAMSLSLAKQRGRGKYGWWEEEIISHADLVQKCRENLLSGSYIDVINYAAMLMARDI